MHELLAPIIYVIRKEIDEKPVISEVKLDDSIFVTEETFDSHCFALFSLILDYTEMWYDNETWNSVESGQKKVIQRSYIILNILLILYKKIVHYIEHFSNTLMSIDSLDDFIRHGA